jgi:molybdopterin synthase sulfur carrier subunit
LGDLGGGKMEVKVLFFGVLAEVAGTNCKHYRDVKSTGDLRLRIQDEFPEVSHYSFRISLNNVLIDNDLLLNDGDEVALMPPFAGG